MDNHRHDIPPADRGKSDREITAALPSGRGLSVFRLYCWDVLRRPGEQGDEFIVTDSSGQKKPWRVFGPVSTQAEAEEWVRLSAEIHRAIKGQAPEWPWE